MGGAVHVAGRGVVVVGGFCGFLVDHDDARTPRMLPTIVTTTH